MRLHLNSLKKIALLSILSGFVALSASAYDDSSLLPGGPTNVCYKVTSTEGGRVSIRVRTSTYGMEPGGDAVVQLHLGCSITRPTNTTPGGEEKDREYSNNPNNVYDPGFSVYLSAGESIRFTVYKGNHRTAGFNDGAVYVSGGGSRIAQD